MIVDALSLVLDDDSVCRGIVSVQELKRPHVALGALPLSVGEHRVVVRELNIDVDAVDEDGLARRDAHYRIVAARSLTSLCADLTLSGKALFESFDANCALRYAFKKRFDARLGA
jgi:hypothetical protein